jgi:hypothetical protein
MDDAMNFKKGKPAENKRAVLHQQIDHLVQFMSKLKPWEMSPVDSLVKSGFAFVLANHDMLFAFLPEGGEVELDLSALKGSPRAKWFNPLTGEFGKKFKPAAGPVAKLTAPDAGDWVLLIRSK